MRTDQGTSRAHRSSRVVAWIGAVFFGAAGIWAMAAPRSFFDASAAFEPYNQHFIQDIGAFMIGLGAVLVLALLMRADALTVGLLGVGVGSAAHTISHIIGWNLGGSPVQDVAIHAALTVALLAAGLARSRA